MSKDNVVDAPHVILFLDQGTAYSTTTFGGVPEIGGRITVNVQFPAGYAEADALWTRLTEQLTEGKKLYLAPELVDETLDVLREANGEQGEKIVALQAKLDAANEEIHRLNRLLEPSAAARYPFD